MGAVLISVITVNRLRTPPSVALTPVPWFFPIFVLDGCDFETGLGVLS